MCVCCNINASGLFVESEEQPPHEFEPFEPDKCFEEAYQRHDESEAHEEHLSNDESATHDEHPFNNEEVPSVQTVASSSDVEFVC